MVQSRQINTNKFYGVWTAMKARCTNKNTKAYHNYGGRGIKVCSSWMNYLDFEKDMFSGYRQGLDLDRIDNNKGYSPENCRWVTRKENCSNTRRNRFITYNGVTKTVTQWAEFLNIKRSTFSQRFYVYNWPIERLFKEAH